MFYLSNVPNAHTQQLKRKTLIDMLKLLTEDWLSKLGGPWSQFYAPCARRNSHGETTPRNTTKQNMFDK